MPELPPSTVTALKKVAQRYCTKNGFGTICKKLGVGGSAAVFLADSGLTKRAVKIYNKRLFERGYAAASQRRIELQKKLVGVSCPFLIDTHSADVFEGTGVVVMEHLPWSELRTTLHSIPEANTATLIRQLVRAVMFLEEQGLVHRDIKPENILISPAFDCLKLLDFGVLRELNAVDDDLNGTDQGVSKPFLATAQYSSPEYLFRTIEPSAALWQGLNLYQIGGVLHDLLTKVPLFDEAFRSGNRYRLALAVLSTKPVIPPQQDELHRHLAALADACLVKDLHTRLQLASLSRFLEEPANILQQLSETLKKNASPTHINDSGISHASKDKIKAQQLNNLVQSIQAYLRPTFGNALRFQTPHRGEDSRQKIFFITFNPEKPPEEFTLRLRSGCGQLNNESILEIQCKLAGADTSEIVGTIDEGSPSVPEATVIKTSHVICERLQSLAKE